MTNNDAAWMRDKKSELIVGPAPYVSPQDNQILIKNHAVAINPLDWIIQCAGGFTYRWLKYPTILGSDVSGEVVEVGSKVKTFKVGDRVMGHAVGSDKDTNNPAEGGFQFYTAVLEQMACLIPDFLPFESAAALPLGLSTAACALYQRDLLGLELPSSSPKNSGKTVLVWGGSSSVGSNAIQLAIASGYEVFTTASPNNFDYVLSLGASRVFDYRAPNVNEEIIDALQGRDVAGAIAIGETGAASCVKIIGKCSGNKFVAIANPPVSFAELSDSNPSRLKSAKFISRLIWSNIKLQFEARSTGVGVKYIFGTTLKSNGIAEAIYGDFLPQALSEARYVAAPPAKVVGEGLQDIQKAIRLQQRGVSAEKIVVKII